jgi:hypothetical protein
MRATRTFAFSEPPQPFVEYRISNYTDNGKLTLSPFDGSATGGGVSSLWDWTTGQTTALLANAEVLRRSANSLGRSAANFPLAGAPGNGGAIVLDLSQAVGDNVCRVTDGTRSTDLMALAQTQTTNLGRTETWRSCLLQQVNDRGDMLVLLSTFQRGEAATDAERLAYMLLSPN